MALSDADADKIKDDAHAAGMWLTDEQVSAWLDLGDMRSLRKELGRKGVTRRPMVRADEFFARYPEPRTWGDNRFGHAPGARPGGV